MYPSTLVIPGLIALSLCVAYRPRILRHGPTPALDTWLLLAVASAAIQTVPIPRAVLDRLSPAASRVASQLALRDTGGPLPLSIDLTDSAAAVALFAGAIMVFVTARQLFDAGGVRTIVRGTAAIGLALAGVAIAQDATGGGLMYWRWKPTFQRTDPFGPFVNRNHYATWAIVAVPLCLGYLMAHATAHPRESPTAAWRARVVGAMDGRAAFLVVSVALMMLGVALSLSRSGMLGLVAALGVAAWLWRNADRHGATRRRRPALLGALVILIAVILIVLRVPPAQVAERVSGVSVALEDRGTIWRETIPIVRDFWLTGTGAGTYQTAMAIYQQSAQGLSYNQAHNHYLQVAAEGGLLLGLPVAIALVLLVREGAVALKRDRSGIYWLRAGAAGGLAGVAVQSLLETGLLTPANSVMAAIAAAILLHVPGRYGPPRVR